MREADYFKLKSPILAPLGRAKEKKKVFLARIIGEPHLGLPSNLQLPGNTLATAPRRSSSKNGLLIMKSTPASGSPEDFNISA